MWKRTGVALGVVLTLQACQEPQSTAVPPKAMYGAWGVESEHINPLIVPGDDFYRYVNDGWLSSVTIPDDLPRMDSFIALSLRTETQLQDIVDSLEEQDESTDRSVQQLSALYASFTHLAVRDRAGIAMLSDELAQINDAQDDSALQALMALPGMPSVVDFSVRRDPHQPDRYALFFSQAELGLPSLEYYLSDQAPYPDHRQAYQAYITGVLERAGVASASSQAKDILAFEIAMAEHYWTPADSRDVIRNTHRMTMTELQAFAPGLSWASLLKHAGFGEPSSVIVSTDTAVKASADLFGKTPVATLQAWMRFHYLDGFSELLSAPWRDAYFDFYSRRLKGVEAPRSQDKLALQFLNQVFGEPLGKLYVRRFFPEESKASMEKMVGYLRSAFHQRIAENTWMDEATRQQAFAKLDAFTARIGYPDRWRDMSNIRIEDDDVVGNVQRIIAWHRADQVEKLAGPARDWEWGMTPQTVNAYYSRSHNEIVFPAAILQPPFFDPAADPAVNYGAIGMVIGHELSHGFDDQGSRYDGRGVLREWWSTASRERFDERADRLAKQYEEYRPLPDMTVNGRLTLGENMGDLGGLTMAHTAYREFLAANPSADTVVDGYTAMQRFFLGYAQLWRALYRDEHLRQIVLTNPHSPNEFRVNGVVRNMDAWYKAFDVSEKQVLYFPPEQRVRLW